MTSAGTTEPGLSIAARVARVTPSLIRRYPSFPRTTCKGGMPSSESPYLEICLASLPGSAPCRRLGGRCKSPGSTSMNSGMQQPVALGRPVLSAMPIHYTSNGPAGNTGPIPSNRSMPDFNVAPAENCGSCDLAVDRTLEFALRNCFAASTLPAHPIFAIDSRM